MKVIRRYSVFSLSQISGQPYPDSGTLFQSQSVLEGVGLSTQWKTILPITIQNAGYVTGVSAYLARAYGIAMQLWRQQDGGTGQYTLITESSPVATTGTYQVCDLGCHSSVFSLG